MEVSLGVYAVVFLFFFIVIPGYIFRRFYCNGVFSKQVNWTNNILANFLSSFVTGIIISIAVLFTLNIFSKTPIDLDNLLLSIDKLIVSVNTQNENPDKFKGFADSFYYRYLPFIFFLYLTSAFLGFLLSKAIQKLGLDTRFKIFRYENNWHYLFSGKILRFKKHDPSIQTKQPRVKYTYVDVLAENSSEKPTLYSGLIANYDLNFRDPSKLDRIYLYKAARYKKSESGEIVLKSIPGNIFTLLGPKIININCTYIGYNEAEEIAEKYKLKRSVFITTQAISVLLFFLLLISFLTSYNFFRASFFEHVLKQGFFVKVLFLFELNWFLGLFTPFKLDDEKKTLPFIGRTTYIALIVINIICLLILWYFWRL